VLIDGTSLRAMSDNQKADLRARKIGFVFQAYNLLPVLDAAENVELPLLLTNLGKRERAERTAIALGVVGLEDRMDHYPRQLSGGQEQRVAIARAIVGDPTLILLDEPTGQLDSKSSEEVLDLLRRLNEEFHKTIMMVTHDAKAAERAKTVLHLEKGVLLERERAV
jgi:putative ABC transport system ATP-binding protein